MIDGEIMLEASWKEALEEEFDRDYMRKLSDFLRRQKEAGKTVYPPAQLIFNALDSTPLDQVKIIIIGQDPYHGPGQANGLAFSVQPGVKVPPSLRNIFKELQRDVGMPKPGHGCLTHWAEQGVLLLNAVLTVEECAAGSHARQGWERFTTKVIEVVAGRHQHLVFMLWGSHARKKAEQIDLSGHRVLTSAHPSPLSAHRGFLGNGHFSAANAYLKSHGRTPVDWYLPESAV